MEDCYKLIEKMYFDFGCQLNPFKFDVGDKLKSTINGLEGVIIKKYRVKDLVNRDLYRVENDYDKVYELFNKEMKRVDICIGEDCFIKLDS